MITEPNDDLIWISFRLLGISLIQVSIFILLYEAAIEIYTLNFGSMNKIFGFGMQINDGIYLLSILAAANTFTQIFAKKQRVKLITVTFSAALWVSYWGNIANEVPNRFLLLSILGIVSLLCGLLLTYRMRNLRFA